MSSHALPRKAHFHIGQVLGEDAEVPEDGSVPKPKTRAECENGMRPCPFVSCRYNLFLDVTAAGSIIFNYPEVQDLSEMPHTCALDVADLGGTTLEETGRLMHLTRERIRQIEQETIPVLREMIDE